MGSHGIMFHHFHGGKHPEGQGSLSSDDFQEMLLWLRSNYRVLDASDYFEAALSGTLTDLDTCLTFDDSLLCQYEIAAPILADEGLTAFYFVYSSAFTDEPDMLEVYRYFRTMEYPDFDAFCDGFISQARLQYEARITEALDAFDPDSYLTEFPFYSRNDRIFRYVRDQVLTSTDYAHVMSGLMDERGFEIVKALKHLYMTPEHLEMLQITGNIVGLHSHTHPTRMDLLDADEQRLEFTTNSTFLTEKLGRSPTSMSHPCGRYTRETLRVLTDLGVRLGFRSSLSIPKAPSLLEIPREDHANILEKMQS